MSSAETFRSREVYRYYQPRNFAEPTEILHNGSGPAFSSQALSKVTNFNTQQSFSDTALTAFAQLIALRLDSQRAIVSLIDHENEYFLAESTSTLSLIDENSPAQNASLSISGARVPRTASLCEKTLQLSPNRENMHPWYLVPDLRLDEKMSELECVKGSPYLRFYCGVALTSKAGINLGCVYVVDDRPRTDISLDQAQFLTRMAAIVMDHLENIRAKEDIVRVTSMSQALHAFIEGDGTMDGDWQRLKRYNLPLGAGVGFHWETNKDDGVGSFSNGQKQLGSDLTQPSLSDPDVETNILQPPSQSPLQHTGSDQNQDARFNFNNSPWSSSDTVPMVVKMKSVFEGVDDAKLGLGVGGSRDTEFSNDGFSNLLHSTFSRASNLIREGMEVDGAVFFDAPFRFYQGRSTLETDPRRSDTYDSNSSSEDDEPNRRPGPRPHVLAPHFKSDHRRRSEALLWTSGLKSDVLGFSTKESSSWNNEEKSLAFEAVDQSLLTCLVKRYPQGELFVFDEHGPISPGLECSSKDGSQDTIVNLAMQEKNERHRARKRAEITQLLVAFPGARQIFFVPLYDSTSGCFIGSFAWSTSATRIFSVENHLSYLIAFGHSVMSEVSRLNTLSADRAKGDFISNVSHELRSPLHGVLASIEFLADTSLDGFQRNLVDTVDICGRTLLDTIEHVLDFSKIKKFGQETIQPMGVVTDLDISAVIEEVLEGVYAGFEFNGLSSQGLADTTKSRGRTSRDAPMNGSESSSASSDALQYGVSNELLTVIIDIDFRDQWKFPTVPGAWRRLTMNVFGNALKYTHDGFIKVKLEARIIPPSANSTEQTMVTLTISDSGQGMSSEFMKTKLFMPFSQEDVTAPGTGLGMSIVKQIVDLSGGRIDVSSDLDKGTEFKLSLPLQNSSPDSAALNPDYMPEDPVNAVRRRAYGRTVSIRGFENTPGTSELQKEALASLKASMEKYVIEWFKLKITPNDQTADIIIFDENAYLNSTSSKTQFQILLVLCSNGARRDLYPSQVEVGRTIEYVSKPCGPHRLAKALLNCLDTEEASPSVTPEEKASFLESKIATATSPKKNVAVTAGTINSRLIGALQSSIGYAPTVIDILQQPTSRLNSGAPDRLKSTVMTMPQPSAMLGTLSQLDSSSSDSSNNLASPATSVAPDTNMICSEDKSCLFADAPKAPLTRPKMLLVEDNPVNMMLLTTYMKKNNWEFEKASNGLLAHQAFEARLEGFDVIFMDVSMPVMGGYESTRHIRAIETDRRLAYEQQNILFSSFPLSRQPGSSFSSYGLNSGTSNKNSPSAFFPENLTQPRLKLNPAALIIALTGFSSENDQEMAFDAGMDIFMTKPVRFREVGRILEGWMRSREKEDEKEREDNRFAAIRLVEGVV